MVLTKDRIGFSRQFQKYFKGQLTLDFSYVVI